jgi:hypothetical protein
VRERENGGCFIGVMGCCEVEYLCNIALTAVVGNGGGTVPQTTAHIQVAELEPK